jgi:hypothetical protein
MKQFRYGLIAIAISIIAPFGLGGTSRATSTPPLVYSQRVPVQSGFDRSENFCGTTGTIRYSASEHQVQLGVRVSTLKPERQYLIDWLNNNVRGYSIGAFLTDRLGSVAKGSLKMYRAGEVRAEGLRIYYLVRNTPTGWQRFEPC